MVDILFKTAAPRIANSAMMSAQTYAVDIKMKRRGSGLATLPPKLKKIKLISLHTTSLPWD